MKWSRGFETFTEAELLKHLSKPLDVRFEIVEYKIAAPFGPMGCDWPLQPKILALTQESE